MMGLYLKFGEECAALNIVPSFSLFEDWMNADFVSGASRSTKQPSVPHRFLEIINRLLNVR
jgi:hypothetical protein